MTKQENCVYFKGVLVHSMPSCNCIRFAIEKDFFVAPLEKKRY